MGKKEIELFLSHLATHRNVSASTQNQAFNAIVFLYHKVLDVSLDNQNINALRAKQRVHLPTVLSTAAVKHLINQFNDSIYKTITQTLYGCGLRISEALNLRIKDLDFDFNRMIIWDSKSLDDRSLPLPQKLIPAFKKLIDSNQITHQKDLTEGYGSVELPNALKRKYPKADKEFKWQYLFQMNKVSKRPKVGCYQTAPRANQHLQPKFKKSSHQIWHQQKNFFTYIPSLLRYTFVTSRH